MANSSASVEATAPIPSPDGADTQPTQATDTASASAERATPIPGPDGVDTQQKRRYGQLPKLPRGPMAPAPSPEFMTGEHRVVNKIQLDRNRADYKEVCTAITLMDEPDLLRRSSSEPNNAAVRIKMSRLKVLQGNKKAYEAAVIDGEKKLRRGKVPVGDQL